MLVLDEVSVTVIHEKIENFKKQLLTPGNFTYDMYHSKSPKKDAILEWAKNLHILHKQGEFKDPLNEISTTIRHWLKENGLDSLVHYAFEVLPHIYKNPKYTHDDSLENNDDRVVPPPDNSSLKLAEDCKLLNQATIKRVKSTIHCLQEFSERLEKDLIFEINVPEKRMEEILLRWDSTIAHLEQSLDKREKITPATHHLLFYAGMTETLSNIYDVYVNYVKDFATVTPKQVGKILKGKTKKLTLLYNPKSKHEAQEMGFYGSQCDTCGSFRMILEGHKVKCFKCDYVQKLNTEYYDN